MVKILLVAVEGEVAEPNGRERYYAEVQRVEEVPSLYLVVENGP
ncbi:MAG TPA: hypothetical protein VFI90_03960 [Rubrobacter sp.]|nr:hypothetical protein [Rubrobacter sp.]